MGRTLAVISLILFSTISNCDAETLFSFNRSDYRAGNNPQAVVAGDFNGDGFSDLAVANYSSNDVSLLWGSAAGVFQVAVGGSISAQNPIDIAAADFNRDGYLDLVLSASTSSAVRVWDGSASGAFTVARDYNFFANGAGAMAVADFSDFGGPGYMDIAVNNSGGLQFLVSYGSNSLSSAGGTLRSGSGALLFTDVNHDGIQDLLVADRNGLAVSIGNGHGSFSDAQFFAAGPSPAGIAVGDFNGDGNVDVVIGNYSNGTVSVLKGNGDGTFGLPVQYQVNGIYPRSIAVADFNRDGYLDFVVSDGVTSTITLFAGKGDGSFSGRVDLETGADPNKIALGDFDNNGAMDFAVSAGTGNVSVFLNQAVPVAPVPEPSSIVLLLSGFAATAAKLGRKWC